jgi:hypothetical protein
LSAKDELPFAARLGQHKALPDFGQSILLLTSAVYCKSPFHDGGRVVIVLHCHPKPQCSISGNGAGSLAPVFSKNTLW